VSKQKKTFMRGASWCVSIHVPSPAWLSARGRVSRRAADMTAPGEAPNDFESIFNNRNVTRVSLSDSDDDVEFPTLRKAAGIPKAKLKPRVRLVSRKRRRMPPVPAFDPAVKAEGDGQAAAADAKMSAEDVGEHGQSAEAVGEGEDAAEDVGDEVNTARRRTPPRWRSPPWLILRKATSRASEIATLQASKLRRQKLRVRSSSNLPCPLRQGLNARAPA